MPSDTDNRIDDDHRHNHTATTKMVTTMETTESTTLKTNAGTAMVAAPLMTTIGMMFTLPFFTHHKVYFIVRHST